MTDFQINNIKNNLLKIKHEKECALEDYRVNLLDKAITILSSVALNYPDSEFWIFGSVLQPHKFNKYSDIDIAVKNYKGSKLDLYTEIEMALDFQIDLVLLEQCSFAALIVQNGLKLEAKY